MRYSIFLLLLLGCAPTVQHYVGHAVRTSDVILNGQGFPSFPVEAAFEEHDSSAILYFHSPDSVRTTTRKFLRDSIGWRWEGERSWKNRTRWPATIRRTSDSLYLSFGWGYGGESFCLRRVP